MKRIHCLANEFHVKFSAQHRYRKNREAMNAISVFQMKFNAAFTCQEAEFFLNHIAKALLRRLWINPRLKVAKLYLLILPGEI